MSMAAAKSACAGMGGTSSWSSRGGAPVAALPARVAAGPLSSACLPGSFRSVHPEKGCQPGNGGLRVRAASGDSPLFQAVAPSTDHLTVEDFMTTRLFTVTPNTTIEQALEVLMEERITGLPVLNDNGDLVGMVSDIDLLAIDEVLGPPAQTTPQGLFPEAGSSWKAFKELQKLILKTKGRVVGDVMSPHPISVRKGTNLDEAARFLLGSRYRRLPVLDGNGKLVGLLTRGNVVRAALEMRKTAEAKSHQ